MGTPQFVELRSTQDVTLTTSSPVSAAVELLGKVPVALQMPAAWTTANLTFQASKDGTTYANIYSDAGVEKVVTAAASRFIPLDPADFVGCRFVKLRSGTSSTAVTQAAARTVTLIVRPI